MLLLQREPYNICRCGFCHIKIAGNIKCWGCGVWGPRDLELWSSLEMLNQHRCRSLSVRALESLGIARAEPPMYAAVLVHSLSCCPFLPFWCACFSQAAPDYEPSSSSSPLPPSSPPPVYYACRCQAAQIRTYGLFRGFHPSVADFCFSLATLI